MKLNAEIDLKKHSKAAAAALLLLALTFIILAMRMHFVTLPLDRDEGTYAYIAWRMDYGEMPYRDIFDHKPPVIYFLYNLAFKMFGANFTAVRGFAALYTVLIMLSVFFAAKKHFGYKAAAASAALFSIYQGSVIFQGINANTELFLLLPMMLAFYFASGSGRRGYFLSGLFFSVAVFIKPMVIYGAFLWAVYWVIKKERAAALLFISGAIAFAAAIFAWLAANGIVPFFIEYAVKFNAVYAKLNMKFRFRTLLYLVVENGLILSSYIFLMYRVIKKKADNPSVLLFLLLTGLAAGIITVGGMYEHYYLILYAPLCVSAGLFVPAVLEEKMLLKKAAAIALFSVFFLVTFPAYNLALYRQPFIQVTAAQYGFSIFYEAPIIAEKIKEMKKPGTSLFVWPGEPEIYFYAGMRSMFREISVLPVYAFHYREQVTKLIQDAEKAKPELVVIMAWNNKPFDWVLANYRIIMMTENLALYELKAQHAKQK